jgi:hypothetical protein
MQIPGAGHGTVCQAVREVESRMAFGRRTQILAPWMLWPECVLDIRGYSRIFCLLLYLGHATIQGSSGLECSPGPKLLVCRAELLPWVSLLYRRNRWWCDLRLERALFSDTEKGSKPTRESPGIYSSAVEPPSPSLPVPSLPPWFPVESFLLASRSRAAQK